MCAHLQHCPTSTHDHAHDAARRPHPAFPARDGHQEALPPAASPHLAPLPAATRAPVAINSHARKHRLCCAVHSVALLLLPCSTSRLPCWTRACCCCCCVAPALARRRHSAPHPSLPAAAAPTKSFFCRTARLQQHGQRVSVASRYHRHDSLCSWNAPSTAWTPALYHHSIAPYLPAGLSAKRPLAPHIPPSSQLSECHGSARSSSQRTRDRTPKHAAGTPPTVRPRHIGCAVVLGPSQERTLTATLHARSASVRAPRRPIQKAYHGIPRTTCRGCLTLARVQV